MRLGKLTSRPLLIGAAVALINVTASAQRTDELMISPDAAKRTLNQNEISVRAAERIAQACVAYANENDVTVSIAILSPSGNLVYAYRMDGQNPIEIDTAVRKAQTVLYMRTSTHAVRSRYGPELQATFFHLGQFPFTGGLPIMVGDQLIGAIGVGGARPAQDEGCAYAALAEVVGPQPPLVQDSQ